MDRLQLEWIVHWFMADDLADDGRNGMTAILAIRLINNNVWLIYCNAIMFDVAVEWPIVEYKPEFQLHFRSLLACALVMHADLLFPGIPQIHKSNLIPPSEPNFD